MHESDAIDHFFLGPKSELRAFLKGVFELVFDDYIYWRRNYHPKDPPAIPYRFLQTPEAEAYTARFHQELFELISDLKLDVPFFSPRYMAHMVSEVALPGLVAYLATMLYNPNNVSLEASPVTVKFELEVGRQFAESFGYDPERSFGHLCSGGTIANYESLWFNLAGKFAPVAMALACRAEGIEPPKGLPVNLWELLNLTLERTEGFLQDFSRQAEAAGKQPHELLRRWSLAEYGDADYRELVEEHFGETYGHPTVLVPQTAHYSWKRSAGLLGFGRRHLFLVEVDEAFRMDPNSYASLLEQCLEEKRPVLQSVAVLGTTEFGSVDPLPELLRVRERFCSRGLYSPLHVDAAYGGYFPSIFHPGQENKRVPGLRSYPWVRDLKRSCRVLGHTESVTVDPHKMGYSPYGAGSIVLKYGFLKQLVAEGAAYALDSQGLEQEDLGKFILEGSKPGAAAAAVWFNHRMMPLNLDGYGKLLLDLCELAQVFYREVSAVNDRLCQEKKPFELLLLGKPETNIVCLMVVPRESQGLAEVDALNHQLALRFGVRPVVSIHSYDFLVSKTRLSTDLRFVRTNQRLAPLARDADSLTALRLVFMNRWVEGETSSGESYMSQFLATVVKAAEEFLAEGTFHCRDSERACSDR